MERHDHRRKQAVRALIHIAALEALVLSAVMAIYLSTHEVIHLAGGLIAAGLIFGPMAVRWHREHGAAMKAEAATGAGRAAPALDLEDANSNSRNYQL